jgi:hypothetical protein
MKYLLIMVFAINLFGQEYQKGNLIVNFTNNTVTENVALDMDGIIKTGNSTLDLLNVQYKCYKIEKLYKGPHPDAQNLYVLHFPINENMEDAAFAYNNNIEVQNASVSPFIDTGAMEISLYYYIAEFVGNVL